MKSLKIATWNVNSLKVRLPHVLQWLSTAKPDVLALQELKMQTDQFPSEAFLDAGYRAIVNGQKTWNGVAFLTRHPTETDIVKTFSNSNDPQSRMLAITIDDIRLINLYIPNGESLTSDKFEYKLKWLDSLHHFIQNEQKKFSNILILGDFNIAPQPEDVHDPQKWEGHILVSPQERAAFDGLLRLGFKDCFRLYPQADNSFSWWDYRMNAFKRNMGLRIDHILATESLSTTCQQCYIDKEPRSAERPSDHTPVVAIFSED